MASVSKPLIQAPKFFNKQLSKSLLKTKIKISDRERQKNFNNQSLLVISCKKSSLNHFYNQNYLSHKRLPLASEGWGNTKSKGDNFTINPYEKNPAFLPKSSNEMYPFKNNSYPLLTQNYDNNGHLIDKESFVIPTSKTKNQSDLFESFNTNLKELLKLLNYERPTNIQAMTLGILQKRKNLIITSETGSGKTLAYILPTINYLLENNNLLKESFINNLYHKNEDFPQNTEYPFVVILAPTKELCFQIYDVVRKFANPLKLRTVLHIGGLKMDNFKEPNTAQHIKNKENLETDSSNKQFENYKILHILVSMPGILNKLTKPTGRSFNMADPVPKPEADWSKDSKDNPPPPTGSHSGKGRIYNLSMVKTLVIDEADTLLDDSFSDDTLSLINSFPQDDNQLILVGATKPTSLDQILGPSFFEEGYLSSVQTEAAHHVMPHVSQTFERLIKPDRDDRLVAILSKSFVAPPKRPRDHLPPPPVTLVFCQDHMTVDHVTRCLKTRLVEVGYYGRLPGDTTTPDGSSAKWIDAPRVIEGLHSKLDSRRRAEIFERFFRRDGSGSNYPVHILITTDLLSRGIDTCFVGVVINYDFPKYISDYIHRIGRVGRVPPPGFNEAKPGRVINFVSSKREAMLVKVVEESVRMNKPLFNVNANIKRKIVALAEREQAGSLD